MIIFEQEFADLPGVNLKKSNVDLNIYVNSLGKGSRKKSLFSELAT